MGWGLGRAGEGEHASALQAELKVPICVGVRLDTFFTWRAAEGAVSKSRE